MTIGTTKLLIMFVHISNTISVYVLRLSFNERRVNLPLMNII